MTNSEMDAIQIQDTVVGEKGTLSPRFILLSQRLVQAAHCAGTRCNSHEGGGDLSDFMRACPTNKHLGQRFGYLRFVAIVALERLAVKLSFPISRDFEILNAPGGSHQIADVGAIAIPSAIGGTFSPRGSNALFQFFTHDLFDQDLDRTHGETT